MRILEQLGFFFALGLVIVFVAGAACGRILSVASGVRAVEAVPPAERVTTDTVPIDTAPAQTLPHRHARTEDRQTIG